MMPVHDLSAGDIFPSSGQTKSLLKVLGRYGVHGLAALNVVLHRDPRVGVSEEFGGEERALGVVDDSGHGPAESVRGDVLDPSLVHHIAQKPADVVRRVRRPHPRTEQQRVRLGLPSSQEARSDRVQRERWQSDAAN